MGRVRLVAAIMYGDHLMMTVNTVHGPMSSLIHDTHDQWHRSFSVHLDRFQILVPRYDGFSTEGILVDLVFQRYQRHYTGWFGIMGIGIGI